MSTPVKKTNDTSLLTDKSDTEKTPARRNIVPSSLKECMPKFFNAVENGIFSTQLSRTDLYKNESDTINASTSLINTLYDKLEAMDYKMAMAMLDLSLKHRRDELRDDERTPRFLHDVVQAIWIIDAIESKYHLNDPELVVALALSHDLGEEYGITPTKMLKHIEENGIKNDERVTTFLKSFDAISKYFGDDEHKIYKDNKKTKTFKGKDVDGHYKDEHDYQRGVREDPHASVAKMFDRSHNLMTLIGVRDTDTIHKEIAKTMHYYAPKRLDQMCESFPCHYEIYEMLEETLAAQLEVLRYNTLGVADTLPHNKELLDLMPRQSFFGLPAGLHPLIATADRVRNHPSSWPRESLRNEL